MKPLSMVVTVLFVAACSKEPGGEGLDGGVDGGGTLADDGVGATETSAGTASATGTSAGVDESTGGTGDLACSCAPGTELIYVVSDDGELFSYDPAANLFDDIGALGCAGFAPFSMAVDRTGRAWLLLLDNIPLATVAKGLFTVDINDPSDCQPVVYTEGLFGVFGMSFVDNPPPDNCEALYVHSYSGTGPFAEGPSLGILGRLDEAGALINLGATDFDGAELAGTSEGRLFSVAGVNPIKVIEYDRETVEELSRIELDGVNRTGASAMAFHGGDFYVFTESGPPACPGCLERSCADELAACEADPACADVYDCLLTSAGQGYEGCEGDIIGPGGPLRDCMLEQCGGDCTPSDVVSRVTRVDYDESDGAGPAITLVEAYAPLRVVGAGSSTCVPVFVP